MTRFVFLSFLFLALGFYELSGGNQFNPDAQRVAAVETRMARADERNESIVAAVSRPVPAGQMARSAEPAAEDTVTQASLNLVSFKAAAPVTAPEPVAAPEPQRELGVDKVAIAALAVEAAANDTPLSLASLETTPVDAGNSSFAGSSQVASSGLAAGTLDIRVIKGDLVNMRSGPGTEYDVIDQLPQATEVEVISGNGQGWVELRPVDGGQTGWIAEFLLSGG